MQDPKTTFSPWVRWAERNSLAGIESPGVYVLAHFDDAPSGPANPTARQVVYIGETCDNKLRGRWRLFARSASEDKKGHAGGLTYREVFGKPRDDLYVAAFPVDGLDGTIRPYFIRYVERKLIWEYARQWGEAPRCNRK